MQQGERGYNKLADGLSEIFQELKAVKGSTILSAQSFVDKLTTSADEALIDFKKGSLQVISGGQTGADLAALSAAKSLGYATGGYMPKDFLTDNGPEPEMATKYNMLESEGGYGTRDRQNVDLCDGLLAFLLKMPQTGRGTTTTIRYAESGRYEFAPLECPPGNTLLLNGNKPIMVIWLDVPFTSDLNCTESIQSFITKIIKTNSRSTSRLMVSGPCAATADQVQETIHNILYTALKNL